MDKEEFREIKASHTLQGESYKDGEESATSKQWREMREESSKEDQDVSLQSPQDANTEKHINFLDTESQGSSTKDSSDETESAPQKEWREMREEKNKNEQDISLQSPQDANT